MKRMLRILLCSLALILALSCAALAESTAMKETITVDGVIYSLSTNGTTYFVSGLEEGYAPEALVVPGSIPDPDDPTVRYKVSSVSSSALPAGVVKSITFPNTLSSFPTAVIRNSQVEEVRFEAGASLSVEYRGMVNVATIEKLYLPDTMTSVGNYAFLGCANLTTVRLPITCNSWSASPFPLTLQEVIMPEGIIVKSLADPFVNDSVKVIVTDPTASKPYPLVKMSRSGNTLTITYGVYGGTGPYKLELISMYDLSTTTKTNVYTNGDYALFTKTLSVSSSGAKNIIANLIVTDKNGNQLGGQASYTVQQHTRQVGVGTPTYKVVMTSNGTYEYRAVYDSYRTETYYTESYSNYWPVDNLIKSISVSPKSAALTPEAPLQLTATTSNGKKDYIWYSSDPSVAVVSETGLVQLVGSGSATIYCHTTDGTNLRASCEVLCLEQMVESITVEALNEIDPDVRTQQMAAAVLPENATLKNVAWSVKTTGEDTASIDESGLLTWHAAGDVRVIASATDGSGVTGSVDLHWDGVPVEEIIATRSADNPMQLAWRVIPENATNPNVTFAVDAPELLSVDKIGHMTFLGDGTANVRLTAADGSGVTAIISIDCFYHPEHTIVVVEESEPTCTEDGTTGGGYCSVCGDVLVPYSAIPATGHELETLLPLYATLNDDGYTHEVACMNCEHVEEESYPISCGRVILTPDGLKEIGEEAFTGVNAQQFIIEEGVETIGSRAFAGCEDLVLMVMPDTLTCIADDAFEGVGYVEFICNEGSYAEEYAIRHSIPYFPH